MVVEAAVKEEQGRPLSGVTGEVCVKKDLTGPTLLEIDDSRPTQELANHFVS